MTTTDWSRFDSDPAALAWARQRVLEEAARLEELSDLARKLKVDTYEGRRWRTVAAYLRDHLASGTSDTVAIFDLRLPGFVRAAGRRS